MIVRAWTNQRHGIVQHFLVNFENSRETNMIDVEEVWLIIVRMQPSEAASYSEWKL